MISCIKAAELSLLDAGGDLLPDPERDEKGVSLPHAVWLGQQILSARVTGNKAHRWLGWMQCLLVVHGWSTLERMKEASRKASASEEA